MFFDILKVDYFFICFGYFECDIIDNFLIFFKKMWIWCFFVYFKLEKVDIFDEIGIVVVYF